MTNFLKNLSKQMDQGLFTSTLTFCNRPPSVSSTYAQSQSISIEEYQNINGSNSPRKQTVQNKKQTIKDIADTKSTEKDSVPPKKYITITKVVTDSTLQTILKEENNNLKQQNSLLLNQIHKLLNANKKYKELYQKQKNELTRMKEEAKSIKSKADQMKGAIMNKLMAMEGRMLATRKETLSEEDSVMVDDNGQEQDSR